MISISKSVFRFRLIEKVKVSKTSKWNNFDANLQEISQGDALRDGFTVILLHILESIIWRMNFWFYDFWFNEIKVRYNFGDHLESPNTSTRLYIYQIYCEITSLN